MKAAEGNAWLGQGKSHSSERSEGICVTPNFKFQDVRDISKKNKPKPSAGAGSDTGQHPPFREAKPSGPCHSQMEGDQAPTRESASKGLCGLASRPEGAWHLRKGRQQVRKCYK